MIIEKLIKGTILDVYDAGESRFWFYSFYKELLEDQQDAVMSFLKSIAKRGLHNHKCFTIRKKERICELKPKGETNIRQIRIFFYKDGNTVFLLGGFIKKTSKGKREKEFYETIIERQRRLKEFLRR
jgi:phage-related protein